MASNCSRSDEVGQLANEFDKMVACFQAARAKVIDSARAAGMAETATSMLHGVQEMGRIPERTGRQDREADRPPPKRKDFEK